MGINAQHPQYVEYAKRWRLTRDVVDARTDKFIREIEEGNAERNVQYREDAILTNFTARTKHGLVGGMMREKPEVVLPSELEYLRNDATGNNLPLDQLAQAVVGDILETGRDGLLVDFPTTDIPMPTQAEVELFDGRARIYKYEALSIPNWHSMRVGSKTVVDLIVLRENESKLADDGFTWVDDIKYRVLRLMAFEGSNNLVYTQQLFNADNEPLSDLMIPRKADGETWSEIPFVFIGSENNDSTVDNAPLYDLSKLNIAHLKNSADYEESVHIVGQPTLFFTSSISVDQVKDAFPNGKITIGSRTGHLLGTAGNAQLLQAQPNQLADVAMKRKEDQAIMLGARLITPAADRETAEGVRLRHGSEVSIMSTIVNNASRGLEKALGFCGEFMGVDATDLMYQLNNQFFDKELDPQTIIAELQLLNSGVISVPDLRQVLRKGGLLPKEKTDDEIDDDIQNASATLILPNTTSPAQQAEDAQDEQE
jgi:hypothetical protein